MNKPKKSKLSWTIDIAIFLLLSLIVINSFKPVKWEQIDGRPMADPGDYNYCVQWAGFIDRATLVFQCYNFLDKEVICDFDIEGENDLVIYSYPEGEEIARHKCTMYTKAMEVEHEVSSIYAGDNDISVPIDGLID